MLHTIGVQVVLHRAEHRLESGTHDRTLPAAMLQPRWMQSSENSSSLST